MHAEPGRRITDIRTYTYIFLFGFRGLASPTRQLLKEKSFTLQALQAAGVKAVTMMPEEFWQDRWGQVAEYGWYRQSSDKIQND